MSKNIVLCFDGTCNEPGDAVQKASRFGGIEDGNITNILKLHLLLGGDLRGDTMFSDQISFYYPGVGTYGSKIQRIFNSAFAPDHLDVSSIIRKGVSDLQKSYVAGDEVFIFGFSRGAAIARRFAAVLKDHFQGEVPEIRFAGIFDTVASMGKPNLDDSEKPVSDVIFENQTISPLIREALHLVALDERRKAFMPTLMNRDPRVTEVWMAGAHADVGGGYRQDGLSDLSLHFMLEEIERRGLDLGVLSPAEIDYDRLVPRGAGYTIDMDDVIVQPNPFGVSHRQERPPLTTKITLAERLVRVNVNDRPSHHLPLVHHAVADRIYGDRDYLPPALRGIAHQILGPGRGKERFKGLQDHLRRGARPLKPLRSNQSAEVVVHSNLPYNRSGYLLEEGARYVFEVDTQQRWYDAGIACGPAGWSRRTVKLGPRELFIRLTEHRRRIPEAGWFELCGSIDDTDRHHLFRILHHGRRAVALKPARTGELCAFANDLASKYGNNLGAIRFKVRKVG